MCYSLLQDFHMMQVCLNDSIIEERSGTKELSGTIKNFEYKKKKKKTNHVRIPRPQSEHFQI